MSFRRSLDGAEKCALRVLRRDEVTEDEYFIARVVKRRSRIRAQGFRSTRPRARAPPSRSPSVCPRVRTLRILCVWKTIHVIFIFRGWVF